jgi:hypothetical protein
MDFTQNFAAINLLVVFGATIAANLLGGLWYSPIVFGKPWRALTGKAAPSGEVGGTVGVFISSFVLHLIAASLLAALLGVNAGAQEGARLGALIGFGFVFTAMGATNLFEQRPIPLVLINSGYHIVSLSVMGLIIGKWG